MLTLDLLSCTVKLKVGQRPHGFQKFVTAMDIRAMDFRDRHASERSLSEKTQHGVWRVWADDLSKAAHREDQSSMSLRTLPSAHSGIPSLCDWWLCLGTVAIFFPLLVDFGASVLPGLGSR